MCVSPSHTRRDRQGDGRLASTNPGGRQSGYRARARVCMCVCVRAGVWCVSACVFCGRDWAPKRRAGWWDRGCYYEECYYEECYYEEWRRCRAEHARCQGPTRQGRRPSPYVHARMLVACMQVYYFYEHRMHEGSRERGGCVGVGMRAPAGTTGATWGL